MPSNLLHYSSLHFCGRECFANFSKPTKCWNMTTCYRIIARTAAYIHVYMHGINKYVLRPKILGEIAPTTSGRAGP